MQPAYLMRPALGLVAAVALALAAAPQPVAAEDKADDGWVPLFNGKDFTGWKIPDPPSGTFKAVKQVKNDAGKVVAFVGVEKDKKQKGKDEPVPGKEVTLWQIKDGMIVGGGPASHIFTELEADNFHYRVEAKINDKGNSGQYFRTKFGPGFPAGYEAQINATGGDRIKTGSLYLPAVKEVLVLDTAPNKPDEFFVQEVIANDDHIQIFVNGKKTVDYKDPKKTFTKGHFALQGHDPGSIMTFKKVEYKPIKK